MRLISKPVVAVSRIEGEFLSIEKIGQHTLQNVNKILSRMGDERNILPLLAGQEGDHHGVKRKFLVERRKA